MNPTPSFSDTRTNAAGTSKHMRKRWARTPNVSCHTCSTPFYQRPERMGQPHHFCTYECQAKGTRKASSPTRKRRHKERETIQGRARRIVEKARERGYLFPEPCQKCGSESDIHAHHAHHEDYKKPLNVRWLCAPCHRERHRELDAQ